MKTGPAKLTEREWSEDHSTISFGAFKLSLSARLLSKGGRPIQLGGRAFDILVALVERTGQVVSKTELISLVWPDVTVDEGSLRFHIASLRKVLNEEDPDVTYVTTVNKAGYCFVAPVARSDSQRRTMPKSASVRPLHRLPIYPSRIVGRDRILQDLKEQLIAERFVTIVGPGGIGKTMLAVEIGRALLADFEGEVVFSDLALIRDPRHVSGSIASALGLLQSDDPVPGLIAYLRDRRTLLILDSCEHVIEQVALLAEHLFQDGPQIYILATSREALRVDNERVRTLLPLDFPPATSDSNAKQVLSFPAAQLFVERMAANGYPIELDDISAPLVVAICSKLDGIPLAIELAAGSVGAFGLQETAARLNSRIELLWEGRRTAPPRHQTLGATLDWSYLLLRDSEQAVLRRVSVFAGSFSLEAALAVATGPDTNESQVVSALADLVTKSLVAVDKSKTTAFYRLLDITRTYATGKLIDNGEAEDAARKHAVYFLDLLERTSEGPPSMTDGKVFSSFGDHLGNVRAALEWSFRGGEGVAVGIPLAAAAGRMFMESSLLVECSYWSERAIATLDEATRGTRPDMELHAALGFSSIFTKGNSERARLALEKSLLLAGLLGDPSSELRLLSLLHIYHTRIGNFRVALDYAERCEPVAKMIADPLAIAEAHTVMGFARVFEGKCARARFHLEAALVELRASHEIDAYHFGGLDFPARVRIALAQALWLEGLPDQSLAIAQDTIEKLPTTEHPVTVCIVLVMATRVFLWNRNLDSAERCVDRMFAIAVRHSLLPYQAQARAMRGELLVRRGGPALGVAELRAGLEILHAARYELMTNWFMTAVAEGLSMMGQYEAAIQIVDETIALARRNGELVTLPELFRVKGSILSSTRGDDQPEAEKCFLTALDLASGQGALAWELRTAISLAHFRAGRASRDEARKVLKPVYDRFTEGFDHADLLAAQSLLRELS